MEIGLIVLGAVLALAGGMVVDLWRALREGRGAAIAIYTELGASERSFGWCISRTNGALGLSPGGRAEGGALVRNLSARDL